MSLELRLDTEFLGSVVKAHVRPAVEAALQRVDLQALIEEQLGKPEPRPKREGMAGLLRYWGTEPESATTSLLDRIVKEVIGQVAKEFVQTAIRNERAGIEEALLRMLAKSQSQLTQSFAKAIGKTFEEDWEFELETTVKHKGES